VSELTPPPLAARPPDPVLTRLASALLRLADARPAPPPAGEQQTVGPGAGPTDREGGTS
jgi:hypothetical protein